MPDLEEIFIFNFILWLKFILVIMYLRIRLGFAIVYEISFSVSFILS